MLEAVLLLAQVIDRRGGRLCARHREYLTVRIHLLPTTSWDIFDEGRRACITSSTYDGIHKPVQTFQLLLLAKSKSEIEDRPSGTQGLVRLAAQKPTGSWIMLSRPYHGTSDLAISLSTRVENIYRLSRLRGSSLQTSQDKRDIR